MSVSPASSVSWWQSWRCAGLVAGVTAVVWLGLFHFPMFWVVSGIGEANRPFIDLYGLLVAFDAQRLGLDPFVPSNLDPYRRPHLYSDWWLVGGKLGLGRKDVFWLGTALVALLVANLVAMARPRTWREGAGLLALLLSPAFLFAANRANNDLIILVLVSGGLLCFGRDGWPWRILGILLFSISAVLKYYPLATLVLLLESRTRRDFFIGLGLYALVLVFAWPGLEPGLKSAARFTPQPLWLYAYGAPILMRNYEVNQPVLWLVPAAIMGLWSLAAAWRERKPPEGERTVDSARLERGFVCGAAMLVGLFFLGASFVYKMIFAIWLLPWLWERPLAPPARRWRRVIWWLLFALVWFEGFTAIAFNLVAQWRGLPVDVESLKLALSLQQVITWALVACLLRFLMVYLVRWALPLLKRA